MNSVARGMNQIGKKSYYELISCLIAVFYGMTLSDNLLHVTIAEV